MAMQLSANLAFTDQVDGFTHEIVTARTIAELGALRGQWTALARDSDDGSLCDGYEYCELAASNAFARQQPVDIVLVRERGELVALWPFAIERRGLLRLARRLTCGIREEYGRPLIRRGAGDGVWQEIATALTQVNADVLEVHWACKGTPLFTALQAMPQMRLARMLPARVRGYRGYVVALRNALTFDAFETSMLSSKFRQSLRRRRRQLEQHGKIGFDCCKSLDETVRLVRWIFEQKRAWANARGIRNESLDDDRVITFFCGLAARLDLTKHPLVAVTTLDGKPVAASLNTIGSKTIEGGITTYDPAYGEFSVGTLHQYDLFRWAHARSLDFDLRPVQGEYKERWATRRTWHETQLLVLTVRGRLFELTHLRAFAQRIGAKLRRDVLQRIRPPAT